MKLKTYKKFVISNLVLKRKLPLCLVIFFLSLSLISCSAMKVGLDHDNYQNKWWIIIENDSKDISGYTKLQQEMEDSENLDYFIGQNGLPEYIFVSDLWEIQLVYLKHEIVYVFNIYSESVKEEYPISDIRISKGMPHDLIKILENFRGNINPKFMSET